MGVFGTAEAIGDPLRRRPTIAGRDLVLARLFINVEVVAVRKARTIQPTTSEKPNIAKGAPGSLGRFRRDP